MLSLYYTNLASMEMRRVNKLNFSKTGKLRTCSKITRLHLSLIKDGEGFPWSLDLLLRFGSKPVPVHRGQNEEQKNEISPMYSDVSIWLIEVINKQVKPKLEIK